MSYRSERRQLLTRQLAARIKDIAALPQLKGRDGKPRNAKDLARIKRAIELDAAYIQRELAGLDEPATGLSSPAPVGKPFGRIKVGTRPLPPFDVAFDLWHKRKLEV